MMREKGRGVKYNEFNRNGSGYSPLRDLWQGKAGGLVALLAWFVELLVFDDGVSGRA